VGSMSTNLKGFCQLFLVRRLLCILACQSMLFEFNLHELTAVELKQACQILSSVSGVQAGSDGHPRFC